MLLGREGTGGAGGAGRSGGSGDCLAAGQLSVYLRELGVPVPSIYGPSADENPFAN